MGRNAIFLAIGFTALCLLSGLNLSYVSVDALKNAILYQESTNIHNISQTGVNFACNQLFQTPNWRAGYQNVPFGGGTFTVVVNTIVKSSVVNGHTLVDSSRIQVVTTATYEGATDVIKILLQPSLFSKFAYFSNNEPSSIVWTTGDTVWGPYHSNTMLYVDGNPVFNGKTTNFQGLHKANTKDAPQFNKGYETGIFITMPAALTIPTLKAQQMVDGVQGGYYSNGGQDLYLNFNANGTVTYRTGTSGAWTTQPLSTFAGPNQVVVVNNANIHIKGIVNGQVTIAATSSSTNKGQVWIDSSVAYNNDPLAVPCTSTDMLGICATNNIMIASNKSNNDPAKGVTIQGSLFSSNGGLAADSATTKVPSGQIHLLGGVSQQTRQTVGVVGGGHGYLKSYNYDVRMMVSAPPAFPTTGAYEILEWLE